MLGTTAFSARTEFSVTTGYVLGAIYPREGVPLKGRPSLDRKQSGIAPSTSGTSEEQLI